MRRLEDFAEKPDSFGFGPAAREPVAAGYVLLGLTRALLVCAALTLEDFHALKVLLVFCGYRLCTFHSPSHLLMDTAVSSGYLCPTGLWQDMGGAVQGAAP
jgi:hypothetical protein